MQIPLKPLAYQTIVITGASSGIGLATARAAAKKGARLVLAARNEEALKKIVSEISENDGQAVYVVADVGLAEDVQRIADTAVAYFGGFDTWVNDAGTGIFGKIEQVSDEDSHRLFDTNFWGVVYGSLAAIEHLKNRGGALINIGSAVSDNAAPGVGMYAASKHAVKGFTEALRLEMEQDKNPVSVTLIKPAAVSTPFFEHARNYTEQEPTPALVYAPEEVAKAILYAATTPVNNMNVGGAGYMANFIHSYIQAFANLMHRKQKPHGNMQLPILRNDNLYAPVGDGHVNGERLGRGQISWYTRSRIHPVATGVTIAAFAGVLAFLAGNSNVGKKSMKGLRRRISGLV
jgi:short-subunit dehydrogenase